MCYAVELRVFVIFERFPSGGRANACKGRSVCIDMRMNLTS